MLEMAEARKDADKVEEHYDLLSGLLDAAQDEPGSEAALGDDELIGWCSLLDHFAFVEVVLPPPRKHVYLPFCWTRGQIVSFFLQCCPYSSYRLQRIHYASHLPCWLCFLANKSVYINT